MLPSLTAEVLHVREDDLLPPAPSSSAQPACGSRGDRGSYNTPLHVIALFIILGLSTLACGFPIVVRRFPKLPVPHRFLFISRHFGTGVLIATAFVHLLPTAFVSLTDPCLPPFWNRGYPAMAGLIAMVSVLVVVGIEMFFASRGAAHVHAPELEHGDRRNGQSQDARPAVYRQESLRPFRQGSIGADSGRAGVEESIGLREMNETEHSNESEENLIRQTASDRYHDDDDEEDEEGWKLANGNGNGKRVEQGERTEEGEEGFDERKYAIEQQQQKKMLLQCLLLEAGILFHSVFIGMALSVATGTSFIVLLVAISFHQTFEGIALGSRIAAITSLPPSSPKPWLMALAYGTTTPLGQAIGLLVHNLYDPASQMGLLMVGVMNAISSGLLLFAGLVELLAEDFLSDKSYEVLYGRRRIEASAAVVGGAMLMAFVGAWA